MHKIGVIAGSGFNEFLRGEEIAVATKYGIVEATVTALKKATIIFLNRHGKSPAPPQRIKHKANISALKKLGVKRVIAISAVGSMELHIKAGDLVLLDQFLDLTVNRQTFYNRKAKHTDVSEPFCTELRSAISVAAVSLRLKLHPRGTYVCVQGPRYETSAEIKAFKILGGDVVGMTIAPECVLARETGLCYAAVSLATNFAAGIGKAKLSHSEVLKISSKKRKTIEELITRSILEIPEIKRCEC